jgi:hypothetical protein
VVAHQAKAQEVNAVARLPGTSLARWAAYAAVIVGLLLVVRGVQLLATEYGLPLPYSFALVTVGALELLLSWFVLQGNRASWSFLTSLNGTMFVVTLFGAPRLRDMLEVDMLLALGPCLVFGTICLLAAFAHEDF